MGFVSAVAAVEGPGGPEGRRGRDLPVVEPVRRWWGVSVSFLPLEGRRWMVGLEGPGCVCCVGVGWGCWAWSWTTPFSATLSARRAAFSAAFCFFSSAPLSFVEVVLDSAAGVASEGLFGGLSAFVGFVNPFGRFEGGTPFWEDMVKDGAVGSSAEVDGDAGGSAMGSSE